MIERLTYLQGSQFSDGAKDIPRQLHDIIPREYQHLCLFGQMLQNGSVFESLVRAVDHVLQSIVVVCLATAALSLELWTTIAGQYCRDEKEHCAEEQEQAQRLL